MPPPTTTTEAQDGRENDIADEALMERALRNTESIRGWIRQAAGFPGGLRGRRRAASRLRSRTPPASRIPARRGEAGKAPGRSASQLTVAARRRACAGISIPWTDALPRCRGLFGGSRDRWGKTAFPEPFAARQAHFLRDEADEANRNRRRGVPDAPANASEARRGRRHRAFSNHRYNSFCVLRASQGMRTSLSFHRAIGSGSAQCNRREDAQP